MMEKVNRTLAVDTGDFSELPKQPLFDCVKVAFGNSTGI
jgi:hypothetical protein